MEAKVLEVLRVAPPPELPLPSSPTFPATFFDLYFCSVPPVTRLFLYRCTTTSAFLPALTRSLSLALHRFYPLAGRLVVPEDGSPPVFSYSPGDSVPLVVAESGDDLDELASNVPKKAERLHSLVPSLPSGDEHRIPVLSLQVTVFPGRGIGVGVCAHHGVADGSATTHFLRTWASLCRLPGDEAAGVARPVFDRALVPDRGGALRELFWKQMKELRVKVSSAKWQVEAKAGKVRATFVLTRAQIDALRTRLMAKSSTRYSTFTLVCAVIWVCRAKAQRAPDGSNDQDFACFGFVHNCRARLDPPVPAEYLGNCSGGCGVIARRGEMVGEDAVAEAAARIRAKIGELEGGGALKGVEGWIALLNSDSGLGPADYLTVAGSPHLRVYGVDFGWGRPAKVEVLSIEGTGAMSLAENADEGEGGLEVGLVLPVDDMERLRLELESLMNIMMHP